MGARGQGLGSIRRNSTDDLRSFRKVHVRQYHLICTFFGFCLPMLSLFTCVVSNKSTPGIKTRNEKEKWEVCHFPMHCVNREKENMKATRSSCNLI